jgi:2-polyprenyl-3-methyl-5-hydroxy-6-metoxy-1,4-benzoquinol methylase
VDEPSSAERVWKRYWTEHAIANVSNPANGYRRELIFDRLGLRDAPPRLRLLDVGCGAGEFALHLARVRPDAEVVGLDASTTGIELARRKVPEARFCEQDLTRPLTLDGFDGWATHAVCTEVLEHFDDPPAVLRNVRRLFAPGCRLVVTVPAGPMSAFDRHVGHRRHYTSALLRRTIEDAGMRVLDLREAGFPFFNLYRLAVVARGGGLVEEAARGEEHVAPATRFAIHAFSWLFRMNTSRTHLGWQLVAVGEEPE